MDMSGQKPMTRAIVAVEMQALVNNGLTELRDTPSLQKTVDLIEAAQWTDRLVQLQLWTRLCFYAFEAKDHDITGTCALKALEFANKTASARSKRADP